MQKEDLIGVCLGSALALPELLWESSVLSLAKKEDLTGVCLGSALSLALPELLWESSVLSLAIKGIFQAVF